MANILYLVHRIPFPPNKGDKVRSYHLLKHLLKHHKVFLGTFIDDPEDEVHIETLRSMCYDIHIAKLAPRRAKFRSLSGLLTDDPLTLRYYRNSALHQWVDHTCSKHAIDAAVVFCSAMAQYVEDKSGFPILIDFVDLDSAKWSQYAPNHRWPMSWLYRREASSLLAYERKIALQATRSFFVTEAEAALFKRLAPESSVRVEAMCNGVDADYFSTDATRSSPYPNDILPIVFTGAMDYWPNIDAVRWFASEMLPELLSAVPTVHFYIVGRNPAAEVQALAGEHISVTGTVVDVRPYLQHAGVVVAPLRLARGIQNKILEAMSMERPVVASAECATAVDAEIDKEIKTASSSKEFIDGITYLLANREYSAAMGKAARAKVIAKYSWDAHLQGIDRHIPSIEFQ